MNTPLSNDALDQLFLKARTYNGYHDKPVSTEQLHQIWDLMKMGPTSANMLPARLVWCHSSDARNRLADLGFPRKSGQDQKGTCCGYYRNGSGFS